MNTNKEIKSFFIKLTENMEEDVLEKDDVIYVKGSESYIPWILQKTVKSIEYINDKYKYDYIYRTNLSSFLDFKKMLIFIENVSMNYGGCHTWFNTIIYASGSGFFLSPEASIFLCKNQKLVDYNLYDDISIGQLLNKTYEVFNVERIDFGTVSISDNDFHYRCVNDYNKMELLFNLKVFQDLP